MRIAFIGGGHMATSLVGGLRARGMPGDAVWGAGPMPAQFKRLRRDFDVHGTADNSAAVREADVVVLSVKPQDMAGVARGVAPELTRGRHTVISIAAGIRLADLARWLGADTPVVRAMPNRPALIGAGVTTLCAGPAVDDDGRAAVERVMSAAGATVWLSEESQMDAVTAISGSGPACFFLLAEALEAAGGFSATQMLHDRKPKPHRQLPGAAGMFGAGGAIGMVSAIVGAGGGFISVPFMLWCNVRMHNAVATSASLGFPIAAAGTIGYVISGWHLTGITPGVVGYIHVPALLTLATASVLTAPLGARVAHSLDTRRLKRVFALLLYALAGYMLYKATRG